MNKISSDHTKENQSSEAMFLKIFHTNDIHTDYRFLKNVRAYLRENMGENDMYFDSGDFCDLKDLIIQSDKGYSAADLFDGTGICAMAVGNGEIDLSHDALIRLSSKIPMMACNLSDNNGDPLPGILPSKLIERAGKRFLVIGLTPYYNGELQNNGYNVFSMMGNLMVNKPEEPLRKEIDKYHGQYDFCIVLSHSGKTAEGYILKDFPEVDLCLGGHSHEVIHEKGYSQSGKGEGLGVITLRISDSGAEEIDNRMIVLEDVEDEEFDRMLEEKRAYAEKLLSKELFTIEDLPLDHLRESRLTNFICDAMMKKFNGDFALMHAGIAQGPLLKPVSRKTLIENFPSKLNPTIFPVKGKDIIEAVKLSFDEDHIRKDGRGPGFRGYILGTLGFSSNVLITKEPFSMLIDGMAIDEEKEYRVIGDDYLQRGSGYPSLKASNDRCKYHIWFIRDLVEHYLDDEEVFCLSNIRRID